MTPDEAKKMLASLSSYAKIETPLVLQKQTDVTTAQIKTRIFAEGLNTSYTDIGIYGQRWAKKRKKKGLQTAYVDLKYSGQLEASIRTRNTKNGAEVKINGSKQPEKASYQEDLQGAKARMTTMDIFSVSSSELSIFEAKAEELFLKGIDQILDSFV